MTSSRREVMGGAVASLAWASWAGFAQGATSAGLFDGTKLADNRIAKLFKRVDIALPDIPVLTPRGRQSLSGIGGKPRLIALWAEWCVPCLVEIHDLAKLRPQFVTPHFDIGLIATAGGAGFDRAKAMQKLSGLGAASLPLVVEAAGDGKIAERIAIPPDAKPIPGTNKPGFTLPCSLLVDARGHVRGRAFGVPVTTAPGPQKLTSDPAPTAKPGKPKVEKPYVLTAADKAMLLAKGKTGWTTPDGLAFLRALADGALERV